MYKVTVLVIEVSIAVQRLHDHGNCYKGKHFIWGLLIGQRFCSLSACQGAWGHTDRHGAGGGAESSTSGSVGSRKR